MKGSNPSGEQTYAQVIENIEDGVIALDGQEQVTLINPAAQDITGLSERQCRGRRLEKLFARQKTLLELVRTTLREGRSISDRENIVLRRSSGPPLPLSVSTSPIFTSDGRQEGAVVILRDLSKVRELERAVRRAERLSMLGTMAAGLAHEIKNPLGGIKGAAQLLDLEMGDQAAMKEYTEVMLREVDRVNAIIEELMDLGRPRPAAMSEVNLSRILREIVLLQKEAQRESRVDFLLSLDPSIPPLKGDENLLTRLFLNLIKNAAESIDKQGRVEISSKVSAEYHLNQPGARPAPLIVITIRDTGKGIPPEDLEQIFTPFFTTKDRGTGLGLVICQKIVSEHQGLINVESAVGEGTLFTVSLPFIR